MRTIRLSVVTVAIGLCGQLPLIAADNKASSSAPRPAIGQPPVTPGKQVLQPAAAQRDIKNSKDDEDADSDVAPKNEVAIFAGGCFWCTEFAFEQLAGVIDVQSGYCGGTKATANYEHVHRGNTAHAEAIRITYDPKRISYGELLDAFFDAHDPTQLNRQGKDDIGRQYRSAIFFANDEQKKLAEAKIADLEAKQVYRKRRIVTKLEPLKEFYPAEDYHQDFARRNPLLPYIQSHAVPKAMHVRAKHQDLIRQND